MVMRINGEEVKFSPPKNPQEFEELINRGVPCLTLCLVMFSRPRDCGGVIRFPLWTRKRLQEAKAMVGDDDFTNLARDVVYEAFETNKVENPIGLIIHRCRSLASIAASGSWAKKGGETNE